MVSTSSALADQLLLDGDWRIEAVGVHAARRLRLTHLELAQIRGHRLWEIVPQLVGTQTETLLRSAMRNREPVTFEWLFLPEITLDIRVERASSSLILRVRELTSSDRAFLAPPTNASSRVTPAALPDVTSNPEAAYACSALGRFISANDLALELFGRAPAALVTGRKVTQLNLPRESAAPLQHRIDLALLSGEPGSVEVMHPDGYGKLLRYRHDVTPILDPNGVVRYIVGVARLAPDPLPANAKPVEAPPPPAPAEPVAPPSPSASPAPATTVDLNATSLHRYHALCEVAVALPKDNLRKAPLFGALQRFARAIDAEIYLLHTASADGLQLRFEASGGISYEDLGTAANPAIGEGLCGTAARDDWPIVIEDVQHNDTPEAAEPRAWGARAVVCHPLAVGARLLGTLVFATTSRDRFSPDELAFMRDAAGLAAGSLETRRVLDDATQARATAEHAAQSKDEFLATIAHELRTPLNPALLIASHAANNPALPQSVREDFEFIVKNIRVEVRLIDDLLDVTRAQLGKLSVERRPLNLHSVLTEALDTVKADIEEKELQFTLDLTPDSPRVDGDPVRLQQVFWNILKNAVKFTPRGGGITVRSTTTAANEACIEFTDTGAGLTAEEISQAFDTFAQGEHARGGPSPHGGLGLGLSIARHLVDLHAGRIRIASAGRDCGASFFIELPLLASDDPPVDHADTAKPPLPDSGPSDSATPSNLRILLVEDHPPTREALLRLLVHRRHEVIAAGSVGEARAIALRKPFQLVISDIALPDGNGYELMTGLHTDFGVRGIALTGFGSEQHVDRARAAGFVAHLIKPISIQALEAVLSEVATNGSGPSH